MVDFIGRYNYDAEVSFVEEEDVKEAEGESSCETDNTAHFASSNSESNDDSDQRSNKQRRVQILSDKSEEYEDEENIHLDINTF